MYVYIYIRFFFLFLFRLEVLVDSWFARAISTKRDNYTEETFDYLQLQKRNVLLIQFCASDFIKTSQRYRDINTHTCLHNCTSTHTLTHTHTYTHTYTRAHSQA